MKPNEKKRIRVDHQFLSEALEDQFTGIENHRFLDTKTGEVLYFSSETMCAAEEANDGGDVERSQWEANDIEAAKAVLNEPDKNRYISIDPISSREAFTHMTEFVETVKDKKFQNILIKSLNGSRPFRRFKDALEYDGEERERWFRFKEKKMNEVMTTWLKELELNQVELFIDPTSLPERTES